MWKWRTYAQWPGLRSRKAGGTERGWLERPTGPVQVVMDLCCVLTVVVATRTFMWWTCIELNTHTHKSECTQTWGNLRSLGGWNSHRCPGHDTGVELCNMWPEGAMHAGPGVPDLCSPLDGNLVISIKIQLGKGDTQVGILVLINAPLCTRTRAHAHTHTHTHTHTSSNQGWTLPRLLVVVVVVV